MSGPKKQGRMVLGRNGWFAPAAHTHAEKAKIWMPDRYSSAVNVNRIVERAMQGDPAVGRALAEAMAGRPAVLPDAKPKPWRKRN